MPGKGKIIEKTEKQKYRATRFPSAGEKGPDQKRPKRKLEKPEGRGGGRLSGAQ